MPAERLQKLLSRAGIASRRRAEELILQGRVTVDGRPAKLGDKADPAVNDIRVDGKPIALPTRLWYLAVNKPRGVVTACEPERDEPIVLDLVPEEMRPYVRPVGRLDKATEGLLLLTNDGELLHRLSHPRYGVRREYLVDVRGDVKRALELEKGVQLEDGPARAVEVEILERRPGGGQIRVVMVEGRKREVRRMCRAVGLDVRRLVRVAFGPVRLGRLKPGRWRHLTEEEVRALKEAVGLDEE